MSRIALITTVMGLMLGAAACGSDPATGSEVCTDGVDNDDDGLIDCDDSDCAAEPACDAPITETVCDDGIDDDDDGLIDCDDSDCAADPACVAPTTETLCDDSLDNDDDGAIDCGDTDCAGDPACDLPGTTCGDVLACAQACGGDFGCVQECQAAGCATAQPLAEDLLGCLIGSCASDCGADPTGPACQACLEANCATELAACLADDCSTAGTETDCSNGVDDDADGPADCDDSDCAADPACQASGLTCSDVLVCVQGCGQDFGCIQACQDSGCPSAQSLSSDVLNCILSNCITDCAADPASAACLTCMQTSCGNELAACFADTCAAVEICDNGVDDDADTLIDCDDSDCSSDPACAAADLTCSDVLTCALGCGTDPTCVGDCRASGCASAQTSFDAVQTCMFSNCAGPCTSNPSGPGCQNCMSTSCATELGDCSANTCP